MVEVRGIEPLSLFIPVKLARNYPVFMRSKIV